VARRSGSTWYGHGSVFSFETGAIMANKDKGGSKSSKTAPSKSLKEKRQAKKDKAAKSSSSGLSTGK
jgi:hypothetical protein